MVRFFFFFFWLLLCDLAIVFFPPELSCIMDRTHCPLRPVLQSGSCSMSDCIWPHYRLAVCCCSTDQPVCSTYKPRDTEAMTAKAVGMFLVLCEPKYWTNSPDGRTERKVKRSPNYQSVHLGPWKSVYNFIANHLIVIEIISSGPNS